MKTKKTLGILAMALTALACALPRTAKAAGDIRSIEVYSDPETVVRTYPNLNEPLVAGEKVKFKIRVVNRRRGDIDPAQPPASEDEYRNPWSLQHVGPNDPIADTNSMPQVGLWVSGQRRFAKIEELKQSDDGFFTEFICSYVVQRGDLAMPLKLVRPDGLGEAMNLDGAWYSESYYMLYSDLWNYFPAVNSGVAYKNANQLQFFFGDQSLSTGVYHPNVVTADGTYGNVRDYDLSLAGIYIRAADFDSRTTDDETVWRSIAAGSTTAIPAMPAISVPGGSEASQVLYVWVKDPAIAEVVNGTDYVFKDGVTRKVAAVSIKPGDEEIPFRIRGAADKVGSSTEVFMAATPTNVYNSAGTLLTNFTWRTIRVVEPPPPGMAVNISADEVKTSADYTISVASIDLELTEPWPYDDPLTVTLVPKMKDDETADPWKYIGVSLNGEGSDEYSQRVVTMTVNKGCTLASESGSMLYLYANRADEHTLKGIQFSVDETALSAQARAFFTGAISPDSVRINYNGGALDVVSPVNGYEYFNVPGNVVTDFTIQIQDAIGEISDGTYTVYWDNTGSGSYDAVPGLHASAGGELVVPRRYVTASEPGSPYQTKFYVMNEGGAKSPVHSIKVNVSAPKTVTAVLDKGNAPYKEGDEVTVNFNFSDAFQESLADQAYVFIYPADEVTSNLTYVASQNDDSHTTSTFIYNGDRASTGSAKIKLKDGYTGCNLRFEVEVRDANDNTMDNVIRAWTGKTFYINSTNVAPRISYISMNDTPMTTSGGTYTAAVPMGVEKTFTIGIADPAISYFDFEDGDKAYTELRFWENGAVVEKKLIRGAPTGKSVTHTFSNAGNAQVTAKVRDKDMTDQEFDEAPEFVVNVTVIDAPAISLSPALGSNVFNENDTGPISGRINVELNVPPTGLEVGGSITVQLTVLRNGLNDGMMPVLNRTEIEFKNGQTSGYFYLSELDGTPQSELKGFRINAQILETTPSTADPNKTWRQYYQPVTDFDIFVANVDPKIGPGEVVSTNERPAALNVPFNITWNVRDVLPDQQNMTVTWSYNGSSQTTTQSTTGTYNKQIIFTSAGHKEVTLMVQDKDGGTDTRTWYYKVEASMGLEITPRRPNTGALSAFSQKYTGAVGIGAGRVWCTSADYPTRVSNFTQYWDFQPANDLNPKIYAYGYKVGDVDNGSLGPAGSRDYAVDNAGTWYNTPSSYGSYYTYNPGNGMDSYFYCWLFYDTEEGNSSHLSGTVQPEVNSSTGENRVQMPEADDEAPSFPRTMVEAIFSIERYKEDNVGDINQDGIPDVYAANTTWAGGRLYQAVEDAVELEEGGDLRALAAANMDEDFLPALTAHGGSLVENVQNWARLGGEFRAILEIRGFHDGLNMRADNDGLNRNVRGAWISIPSFSEAESNAIARVNNLWVEDTDEEGNPIRRLPNPTNATEVAAWTAGLNAANSWIPENRTDPTVADTDEDGFPDGYEYYFWYSAMVGVDGIDNRLRGTKFSIDDIAVGEELTPEEIAAAFDPTQASTASANERDTDNDGLTDLEEYALGTSPISWDTDGDGLSDLWEIMRGMNPVKADNANNGGMNADGDFMAYFTTPGEYAIVKIDGLGEYALPNDGGNFITAEEGGAWKFTDGVTNLNAIAVFRYGDASAVCVPKNRGSAGLPPLSATSLLLEGNTNIVSVALGQSLALIHDQVYNQFGFDPRTGWNINDHGYLARRWEPNSVIVGSVYLNGAGEPVNTKGYTARDEYLLLKYRYEATPAMEGWDEDAGEAFVFSKAADKALWNDRKQRRHERVLRRGTTNPNVAYEDPDWVTESMSQTYASDNHGADTDKDGVPDGWELYVGHNPNDGRAADTADVDNDGLNLVAEFAGTDSCNAYSGCETIYSQHTGLNSGWFNKFFPTDPNNTDTDGDGLSDGAEGAGWVADWVWGKSTSIVAHGFTFIYGDRDGKPDEEKADPSNRELCIRGGGLNPCTVDTDGDLLPDAWERQFAGILFTAEARDAGGVLDDDVLKMIRRGDGLGAEGAAAAGFYITGGMDGTYAGDAFTLLPDGNLGRSGAFFDVVSRDPRTGTRRDFDFDHDGLQNFQEYLVQSLRHLRYDDSETPLMGSWIPDGPERSRKFVSFLPMNIMDGDTFYKACKDNGFAATGAWQFEYLGYFVKPPQEWDWLSLNNYTEGMVNYDDLGYRVMLTPAGLDPNGQRFPALGYVSTDPRQWDTDMDGMDDFYEIFHGLNPLLGSVQDGGLDYDVIAAQYMGMINHWCNGWTGWPQQPWNGDEPKFDAIAYPWMMGTPEADADGDGLRNISEALIVNMTSPMPTHTDPTPLWYTDSTALNNASFTVQYYQLDPYVDSPDFAVYPWFWSVGSGKTMEGSTSGTFMYSFEENEGYDTDNDRVADADERAMTGNAISDPLIFADPDRRQAMWFPGAESAAVSYSGYFHRPNGDQYDVLRQFTVEAWICPEDLTREQVVLERACRYTSSTYENDEAQIRANFRIGIKADGRVYGLFDTSDAVPSGTGPGSPTVIGTVPEQGKWQHVALTYDGKELKLHQDGRVSGITATSLEPANGLVVMHQEAVIGMENFPVLENGYINLPCAFVLGAQAMDGTAIGLTEETTWKSYANFYQGYIDEVRVWDGVRTLSEIKASYKKRFSFADVAAQRDEVYAAWLKGYTRNDNDGKGMLPAELLQHYAFQAMPGAVNATDVLWEPAGFTKYVFDNVRDMDGVLPAGTFECGWWSALPVHSTVYENYRWVPWIQNTCGHLPFMDGSCADSRYWSEFFGGTAAAREVYGEINELAAAATVGEVKKILFPNTAHPYPMYNYSSERAYHEFFLNYMAEADASFATNRTAYAFEIRSGFVGTSDLVPLGGAFAKRTEEMWDGDGAADAWEVTANGGSALADVDGNGMPDWWQEIAIGSYGAPEDIEWSSIVKWPDASGTEMTAREAYMRDLASGMLPGGVAENTFADKRDTDKDGMPDWWERLNGIASETAYGDHDNDQLSNYAEYLISEGFVKYGFPAISPIKPNTFGQGVPDYFLRVGSLYLGQMFADGDMISDAWEDLYGVDFASRGLWDALADPDDDGWSNRAEYQAGTRPDFEAMVGADTATLEEYPVPVVEVGIVYNGKKNFSSSPIVVQAWSQENGSDRQMSGLPDAAWTIPGPGAVADKEKHIGQNRNRVLTFGLGPGSVAAGSVSVHFRDPNALQMWEDENGEWNYIRSQEPNWWESVYDMPIAGDPEHGRMVTWRREQVGEINYVTGVMTVDFSHATLQGVDVEPLSEINGTADEDTGMFEYADLSMSSVRIVWQSQKAGVGNSGKFYLSWSDETAATGGDDSSSASGSEDNSEAKATKYGHLREGKNMFVVFADMDSNGVWSPGEPLGVASEVDVGWSAASFSVELTDIAPQMARMDLAGLTAAEDFATADVLTDRSTSVNGSYYSNQSLETAFKVLPDDGEEGDDVGAGVPGTQAEGRPAATATSRIRVIRTAVNGELGVGNTLYNGVVLDREIYLGGHPMLTEADLVADGLLDLDWGTLTAAWQATHNGSAITTALTNATYRVLYGNGSATGWTFNSFAAVTFVNAYEYGRQQTLAAPVAPKGTTQGATVTFQWRHEALDSNGYKIKDYPAFRLQVLDSSNAVVYDSGDRRAPARNSQGVYSWTAPLYDGMVTENGHVFTTKENYKWRVSMLDAKFTTPNWHEAQDFRLEATGMMNDGRRYGTIAANVRYFGPLAESVSTTPSVVSSLIHVQAFSSPDFVGVPVAEGWVTNATELTSQNVEGVNAVTLALPAGTYYVCAYIDANSNFMRDPWESWGYANGIGGSDLDVYKPAAVVVTEPSSAVPGVTIFIEDSDTDQDGFPDAWEYSTFGSLDAQNPAAGDTFFTKVNPGLLATVQAYSELGLAQLATGSDYVVPRLMSVLSGSDADSLAMAYLLCGGTNPNDLVPVTEVKVESFSTDGGMKFSIVSETKSVNGGRLLAAAPDPEFEIVLLSKKSLADEGWTETVAGKVSVPANGKVEVSSDILDLTVKARKAAGDQFFKIKIR
ncbi:MAG: LamG domain-containing protein [Kiritimatiellae bacterium]|nr:LamG domain-containing protein [Kiritimatiellia bacterium]